MLRGDADSGMVFGEELSGLEGLGVNFLEGGNLVVPFQQRGRQLIFREFRAGPKHGDASSSSRPAGGLLRHKAREGRANFCLPSRS